MSTFPSIALFAYAFPHRKSQDFLFEILASGVSPENLHVLAAPWKKLPHEDPNSYFPTSLRQASVRSIVDVCSTLGVQCVSIDHNDQQAMKAYVDDHQLELGIISGARILKRQIIDLFSEGVVNFHPGKIPETSGLDLFYYTIEYRVELGVTAHFIDARVDAGRQIFFEPTTIGPDDTPEVVQFNNYHTQLSSLRKVLHMRSAGFLRSEQIDRPKKNSPMSPEEKRRALEFFPYWRGQRVLQQATNQLFAACETGDSMQAEAVLEAHPQLLEARSPEGWTPLIVAAHHHCAEAVEVLLNRGADPNATGKKGTTVLMYAKTKLLDTSEPDCSILQVLIDAGADPGRMDMFGRTVLDYLEGPGAAGVTSFLQFVSRNSLQGRHNGFPLGPRTPVP